VINKLIITLNLTIIASLLMLGLFIYVAASSPNIEDEQVFGCGVVYDDYFCGTSALYPKSNHNSYGKKLFVLNCKSCHAINKKLIGSALQGMTKKRSKEWLYLFIKNPKLMHDKKDSIALEIHNKEMGFMPSFPALSTADIDSIFDYVDSSYY